MCNLIFFCIIRKEMALVLVSIVSTSLVVGAMDFSDS
ncbi:unnamed protein product, partial [Amoebophrya sp. A120]|eukprot:GSA120T00002009001.1